MNAHERSMCCSIVERLVFDTVVRKSSPKIRLNSIMSHTNLNHCYEVINSSTLMNLPLTNNM